MEKLHISRSSTTLTRLWPWNSFVILDKRRPAAGRTQAVMTGTEVDIGQAYPVHRGLRWASANVTEHTWYKTIRRELSFCIEDVWLRMILISIFRK